VTSLQERPPAATKEEQPYVDTVGKRHTGLWLGVIAVVWVGGWALFQGMDTLTLAFQDTLGFHRWLNQLSDDI